MSVEVFFNRPARPIDLGRLLVDIETAREEVGIAVAWFTDNRVADALIRSSATHKWVSFNAGDLSRNGGIGSRLHYRLLDACDMDDPEVVEWRFSVLGSGSFEDGILHHKFIVIDRRIVWTGSYNLTLQASRNYETLLRIEDPDVGKQFYDEYIALRMENFLWVNDGGEEIGAGVFRCYVCRQILPNDHRSPIQHTHPQSGAVRLLCESCAAKFQEIEAQRGSQP